MARWNYKRIILGPPDLRNLDPNPIRSLTAEGIAAPLATPQSLTGILGPFASECNVATTAKILETATKVGEVGEAGEVLVQSGVHFVSRDYMMRRDPRTPLPLLLFVSMRDSSSPFTHYTP